MKDVCPNNSGRKICLDSVFLRVNRHWSQVLTYEPYYCLRAIPGVLQSEGTKTHSMPENILENYRWIIALYCSGDQWAPEKIWIQNWIGTFLKSSPYNTRGVYHFTSWWFFSLVLNFHFRIDCRIYRPYSQSSLICHYQ